MRNLSSQLQGLFNQMRSAKGSSNQRIELTPVDPMALRGYIDGRRSSRAALEGFVAVTSPPGTFDDLKRDIALLATHLPLKLGDRTLLVLKGHLLTEHLLTEFIRSKVPAPEHIDSEQFRFPQRVALARTLAPKGKNEWVWGALQRLNSLRNTLAHRLNSTDAEKKLDEFLTIVPSNGAVGSFGPLGNALVALYFGLADHLRFKTEQELLVDALRNWKPSNHTIEPTR